MKIIYKNEQDTKPFDMDRYLASLNKYGKVTKEQVKKALEEYEGYDVLHYTVLIEKALELLPDEDSARAYFEDHKVEGQRFERLRRITGYLVGSLERWNDGKRAEEAARVKHSVGGVYTPEEKTAIEVLKLENSVMSQI